MKRVKKLVPIIICLALMITTLTAVPTVATKAKIGTTYYISSSDGNDKNNGLSAQKAWKSFEKVKDLRLTAGDKVLLRRGDTWNERLEINAPNGTAENWVYVGPYGDTKKEAPIIDRLADDNMDDICVLVQDCVPEAKRQCNYVWIDNLTLKNAVLGIYFRYESSSNNKGVRITDCYFENIRSKKWNEWIAENGVVATHDANLEILSQPKGDLPYLSSIGSVLGKYNKTGGGVNEYYGASAVWVGGVSRTENYLVSDIEMQRLIFTNCESGIGSTGYWPKDAWKFTANWSIKDIYTASGGLFFIDGVDCGWDGTEDSKWGIFENLFCEGSIIDPIAMNGTTIAGLITAKNCLIRNTVMNESKNNNYPDGCGYDFERNNINVHIRNSVFANNDGQGVLMMQQNTSKKTARFLQALTATVQLQILYFITIYRTLMMRPFAMISWFGTTTTRI